MFQADSAGVSKILFVMVMERKYLLLVMAMERK